MEDFRRTMDRGVSLRDGGGTNTGEDTLVDSKGDHSGAEKYGNI